MLRRPASSLDRPFDLVDGVDLAEVHGRALVWSYLSVHRPRCVIVSPPCAYFSKLMHISKGKMRFGEYDRKLALGKELLYFAMAVCTYQHSHSRYFVHEHIADASSLERRLHARSDVPSRSNGEQIRPMLIRPHISVLKSNNPETNQVIA